MYENKKVSRITDEIVTYLLDKGATDINVNIEVHPKYTIIKSTSKNILLSKRELDDLNVFINTTHREMETEEYYWTLAGEGHCAEELGLVAIMVDIAEIYYEGTELRMDFLRKK